jgi:hypothetical protein
MRAGLAATANRTFVDGQRAFASVTYIDPFTQVDHNVPIIFQKNARHAYQDEVRAAWLPQQDGKVLNAEFVVLGSLEPIAELISI